MSQEEILVVLLELMAEMVILKVLEVESKELKGLWQEEVLSE